ncbi:MAG: thermonuclease family protein [Cyanobacteria bacterium P01_D01_bin.156]
MSHIKFNNIIDGNTVKIGSQIIQLEGISAPKINQTCQLNSNPWECGKASRKALKKRIGDFPFKCLITNDDDPSLNIGICFSNNINLNAWMIENGWAVLHPSDSKNYIDLQKSAQQHKRGIWASTFANPWEWQKGLYSE